MERHIASRTAASRRNRNPGAGPLPHVPPLSIRLIGVATPTFRGESRDGDKKSLVTSAGISGVQPIYPAILRDISG